MSLLADVLSRFRFQVEQGKLRAMSTATSAAERGLRSATAATHQLSAGYDQAAAHAARLGSALRGGAGGGGLLGGGGLGVGGALGLVGLGGLAAQVVPGIVQANVEFGNLSAQLLQITGSAEKAEAALAFVKKFAADTPFGLSQVGNAFADLSARGIEPTTELLTALGDLSMSSGADLEQLMQGVSGFVATGQQDILQRITRKDWSLKNGVGTVMDAKTGQKTQVKQDVKSVIAYLAEMGKTKEIAGSMEKRAGTLGGQIDQMRAAFTEAAVAIGEAGFTKALVKLINRAKDAAVRLQKWAQTGDNARKMGEKLATGAKILGTALAAVGSAKVLGALGDAVAAVRALGIAGAAAQAKLLVIPAIFGMLFLILEDLNAFSEGRDSMMGRLLSSAGIDPAPVRNAVNSVKLAFMQLWAKVKEGGGIILKAFGIVSVEDFGKAVEKLVIIAADTSASIIKHMEKAGTWLGVTAAKLSGMAEENKSTADTEVATFAEMWDAMKADAGAALTWLGNFILDLFVVYIPYVFDTLMFGLVNGFWGMVHLAADAWYWCMDLLEGAWWTVWDGMGNIANTIMQGVINGVISGFESVINGIIGAIPESVRDAVGITEVSLGRADLEQFQVDLDKESEKRAAKNDARDRRRQQEQDAEYEARNKKFKTVEQRQKDRDTLWSWTPESDKDARNSYESEMARDERLRSLGKLPKLSGAGAAYTPASGTNFFAPGGPVSSAPPPASAPAPFFVPRATGIPGYQARGQASVNIGSITVPVTGTVDMSAPEFAAAVQAELSKTIESAMGDITEAW